MWIQVFMIRMLLCSLILYGIRLCLCSRHLLTCLALPFPFLLSCFTPSLPSSLLFHHPTLISLLSLSLSLSLSVSRSPSICLALPLFVSIPRFPFLSSPISISFSLPRFVFIHRFPFSFLLSLPPLSLSSLSLPSLSPSICLYPSLSPSFPLYMLKDVVTCVIQGVSNTMDVIVHL